MIEPFESCAFSTCKDCKYNGKGQMNMPCRACTFGSKFEREYVIKFDASTIKFNQTILENMDVISMYPNVGLINELMNRRVETMKNRNYIPEIKNVEFNPPLTVVIWKDGTKTFVKAHGEEPFDPEKGLAMAICKKLYGNKYSYFKIFDRWIDKYEERLRKEHIAKLNEIDKLANDIASASKAATDAIGNVSKRISDAINKKKD